MEPKNKESLKRLPAGQLKTRRPKPKNRTKTLLRVVERKKQTIQNIRARQKQKRNEIKKDKLINRLASTLSEIIDQ